MVAGDRRRARETQLLAFIDEQYRALDAMADNRAVVFVGEAGTGKTMMAMEAARREVATGHTGRLLCYNRFLGKLLSDLGRSAGLRLGTLHQEMLRLAAIEAPEAADSEFWDHDLPERAAETLLNDADGETEDFLIVDEIQDIARAPLLDVLDLLVDGGLQRGRVLFFGDFERQAIYGEVDGRDLLRARVPHLAVHRLTENCRNLPRIGYQVNVLSNLQPGYRHFRRQDDGVDPVFQAYKAGTDQSPLLTEAVRQLRDEGYELNEIVVLSPLRTGSTAETTTDPWLRQVLSPADGNRPRPGHLQHSTIHAFKGLESPAVVLTDLDRNVVPNFESLLYVGLTRAMDRLFAVIESGTLRAAFGGSA
jgi:superfamily I DNA/RNA helicase